MFDFRRQSMEEVSLKIHDSGMRSGWMMLTVLFLEKADVIGVAFSGAQ